MTRPSTDEHPAVLRRLVGAALALMLVLGACAADDGAGDDRADDEPRVPPLAAEVDPLPETTVTVGSGEVVAKVAAEPAHRSRGLMHVPSLPSGVGMLFLFDRPSTGGFWMKNTLVPLDIAYLRDGAVVGVRHMDPCDADPCPTYDAGVEYDAALEVNQGELAALGAEVGTPVTWASPVKVAP